VFPLRSGLLVFCASAIVVVALRTRTLRPISAMRFTAMSDFLVVAPDTNRNTSDFLDCPEDKRRRLKLLSKDEARRIAANIAFRPARNLPCGLLGMLLPRQHSEGKNARQAPNRPCLHRISPKRLRCGETIQGEWGIWSPGGRPARAASSLLATPNGPFSFAVLSGRFPPPWSVEELDNERRGRSASSPRSWAVSRNRHHVSILQYSGSPVCSVLNTKVLNLVMAARAQCLLRRDGQRPGKSSRMSISRTPGRASLTAHVFLTKVKVVPSSTSY
jgi:hypothetical protein